MKSIYSAIFTPEEAGGWSIHFPDVPGAITQGDSIEEGMINAIDALSAILALGKKGVDYDNPRPFEDVEKGMDTGERVFAVAPDLKIMADYLKEARPKVRVNVMLEQEVKAAIDAYTKKTAGLDRSQFLNDAARARLDELSAAD